MGLKNVVHTKMLKEHKLISTLIMIMIKCFLTANQHIRLISEGSCDTEDWSSDAENSA